LIKTQLNALAKGQRKLSHQVKLSNNWSKQQEKRFRLHLHIADACNNHLHKVSSEISKNQPRYVVMKDLLLRNLSASGRGGVESQGQNVGGVLELVPAHHTSQTCPE
jgi:putative transposase